MNTIKILLLSLILILSQQLFANTEKGESEKGNSEKGINDKGNTEKDNNENDTSNFLFEHKDLQFTFLFPVVDDQIKLKVVIPKNFKPLQGDIEAELLEFIPNNDKDSYKWSEIITLTKILGTGITAKEYISKMEELFRKNVDKHFQILERNVHSYEGYQDSFSIIQYQANGRDEVVILYSVSGPLDIANVQYALPLSSSDKVQQTVQKLKDFIKNNLEIVKDEKGQSVDEKIKI